MYRGNLIGLGEPTCALSSFEKGLDELERTVNHQHGDLWSGCNQTGLSIEILMLGKDPGQLA